MKDSRKNIHSRDLYPRVKYKLKKLDYKINCETEFLFELDQYFQLNKYE